MEHNTSNLESTNTEPEIWLDHLPLEICCKIVSLLPSFRRLENDKHNFQQVEPLPDALTHSLVTSTQRRGVALAQKRIFRIFRVNDLSHALQLVHHWRTILGSAIREVILPNNIGINYHVCEILALSSVRKAVIPAFPSLLRALMHTCSVRILDLQITNDEIIARETSLDHLTSVLQKCPVTCLTLRCLSCGGHAIWDHQPCLSLQSLVHPFFTDDINVNIKTVSTTLQSLRLICESHKLINLECLPQLFPNLHTFCLKTGIQKVHMSDGPSFTQSVIQILKSIPNLGFINCGSADLFAQHFGSQLTEFTSWIPHSTTSLASLNACPNLKSLHLLLSENVIHNFPNTISSLRSLILEWDGDEYKPDNDYFTPQISYLIEVIQRNTFQNSV